MPVKGSYLVIGGIGAVFLWSSIRGKRVTDVARSLIGGSDPGKLPSLVLIEGVANPSLIGGTTPTGPNTNNIYANLAESYIGYPYQWGGKPAIDGAGDCSSFCNMIIGWYGMHAIPGFAAGQYQGQTHGPNTLAWLGWNGAVTIPLRQAQPGDLVIWQTHMGILVKAGPDANSARMVSDLNPNDGTKETSINGGSPTGEVFVIKRLR